MRGGAWVRNSPRTPPFAQLTLELCIRNEFGPAATTERRHLDPVCHRQFSVSERLLVISCVDAQDAPLSVIPDELNEAAAGWALELCGSDHGRPASGSGGPDEGSENREQPLRLDRLVERRRSRPAPSARAVLVELSCIEPAMCRQAEIDAEMVRQARGVPAADASRARARPLRRSGRALSSGSRRARSTGTAPARPAASRASRCRRHSTRSST